ncbi:hypothetical protein J3Q64DRAFT_1766331 [Phycomyces blakesleeanus]|uniref:Uncharacterized protein n=1 Tax=Phycomyces blakesleeanus TaxID=4837 RepID=A0ABR3APC5_PHYBL
MLQQDGVINHCGSARYCSVQCDTVRFGSLPYIFFLSTKSILEVFFFIFHLSNKKIVWSRYIAMVNIRHPLSVVSSPRYCSIHILIVIHTYAYILLNCCAVF